MIFVGHSSLNGDSYETVYSEEYLKPIREFHIYNLKKNIQMNVED